MSRLNASLHTNPQREDKNAPGKMIPNVLKQSLGLSLLYATIERSGGIHEGWTNNSSKTTKQ